MNFKKFILCFLFFVFYVPFVFADSLLYISDNVFADDEFDNRFIKTLQSFIDGSNSEENDAKDGKKNKKIKIEKFSGSDINTTESIELFDMFSKSTTPKALILMVGESNYYNLYGFSKFMNNRNGINEEEEIIRKNLYEINSEMKKIYEPFIEDAGTAKQAVKAAYKSIIDEPDNKLFRPKVIPEFYALRDDFKKDINIFGAVQSYRHAWDLIRNKEYDKAKEFLSSLIESRIQSMFFYALASAYLDEGSDGCEVKALKLLEEGILTDPLNKENVCYKGVMSLFMMYKGEITAEVLFFSRALNKSFSNISDEISAITAINTPDHNNKIQIIDDWIIFDFDEIKKRCFTHKVPLIYASYPDNSEMNDLISRYAKNSSNVSFVENKFNQSQELDSYIYKTAENMYNFLKEKKILED